MRNELNYMNNANRNDLLWSEHYRCEGMCAGSTCSVRMVWKLSLISKLEKYCRCFLWKKIQFSFTSQLKVCSKGSNCIVSVGSSNFSHCAGNNFSKQCWPKRELGHTELIGNWYAVVIPRHFLCPDHKNGHRNNLEMNYMKHKRSCHGIVPLHSIITINSLSPGKRAKNLINSIFKYDFDKYFLRIFSEIVMEWMPKISSQHWFRLWPGAVWQQAINLIDVDQCLCCHVVPLGG